MELRKREVMDIIQCPRCGYKWIPRVSQPKRCPRCQVKLFKYWEMR